MDNETEKNRLIITEPPVSKKSVYKIAKVFISVVSGFLLFLIFIGIFWGFKNFPIFYILKNLGTTIPPMYTPEKIPDEVLSKGRIYLVPVGDADKNLMQDMVPFIEERFLYKTEIKEDIKIPEPAFGKEWAKVQYVAEMITLKLKENYFPETLHIIGITDKDINSRNSNWRYSWSWGEFGGVQVVSTYRFSDCKDNVCGINSQESYFRQSLVATLKKIGNSMGLPNSDDKKSFMYNVTTSPSDLEIKNLELSKSEKRMIALYRDYEFYIIGNRIDELVVDANKKISENPEDEIARTLLGIAFIKKSQVNKAEEELKYALKLEKDNAWAHLWLGIVYEMQNNYKQAFKEFRTARKQNNVLRYVFFRFGFYLQEKGEYDRALEEYENAFRAGWWYFDVLPMMSSENDYPEKIYYTEKFKSALPELEKRLSGHKNLESVCGWLGRYYYEQKNYEKSLEMFKEAVAMAPESYGAGYSHNMIAWIYAEDLNCNYDEAIEHAKKAVELVKGLNYKAPSMDTLGWAYYKKGDYKNAVKYLRKAVLLSMLNFDFFNREHWYHLKIAKEKLDAGNQK